MQHIYLLQSDCHVLSNKFITYDGTVDSLDQCFKYIINNMNVEANKKIATFTFNDYLSDNNLCYIDYSFMTTSAKSYLCCVLFLMKYYDYYVVVIYDVYNVRVVYYKCDSKSIKYNNYNSHVVRYNDLIVYQSHLYLYIISKVMRDVYRLNFLYSTSKYLQMKPQGIYVSELLKRRVKLLYR